MTADEEARVAALERKVDGLHEVVERLVGALAAETDPVHESFRRFQLSADRQTGRG